MLRWLSCGANHGHWHNLSRSFGVFSSGSLGRGAVMGAVAAVAVSGSDAVWRCSASSQSLIFAQACSGEQIPLLTGAAPPDPGRENRVFSSEVERLALCFSYGVRRWYESSVACFQNLASSSVRSQCGTMASMIKLRFNVFFSF